MMWQLAFFLIGGALAQDLFYCNFESNNCGFVQRTDDTFDWTRYSGMTPSWGTGPSTDVVGYGYYMYIEASSPRISGDIAKMETSQVFSFDGGPKCLSFYYHMYGSHVGSFKVYVGNTLVFSQIGNKGDYWQLADITVPVSSGSHKIRFEAVVGNSYESDIAVDEIVLKACAAGVTPPPPPPTSSPDTAAPPPPPSGSCGIRPTTRIVGGTAAKHGDWPWQAMLRSTGGIQFCGGALVAPQWILTASHCVDGKYPSDVLIRMGAHRREYTVGTEQDFRVTKIVMHPSYHSPLTYSHDIALLKLDRPALLNKYTNLVCLPSSVPDAAAGRNCWITGWGTLSSGGSQPDYLQQASVPIVQQSVCKTAYSNKIHDSMICAGFQQGGVDSCQGDSGGPMVCEAGGRFYIHGATSWGYGCASPNQYGVYARVKYLNTWVLNTMNSN